MFKKTLIGTAAAALIATGATIATTGTASASGITFSGPNFAIGFGTPGFHPLPLPPRQVCTPVYKTVQFWKWGKLRTATVQVGQNCYWVGGGNGNPGPFPPKPYPFAKPGPWAWQQGPQWQQGPHW
ncbi:hypothetical protein BH10PSE9_BH10PSE9_20820 [soil metagenome]